MAWAAERKDVLAALLFFATISAYVWHLRRPSAYRYLAVCAALALGLLAKPMAVTAPFVLLLLDYWPLGRLRRWRSFPRLLAEKLPLLAFAATSVAVTLAAQNAGGWIKSVKRYPLPGRPANAVYSSVVYLRKTFWPSDLATPYGYPEGLSLPVVIVSLLLVATVTALVLLAARRTPFLAVGWFWYLGMLVPVIGIVQVSDQGMADRYTYLPLVGVFLGLAWGLRAFAGQGNGRRPALALFASGTVAVCALLIWRQVGYWRSDLALSEHAVRVTPRNWLSYNNYGARLIDAGRYAEAEAIYDELLRNGQIHTTVLVNLGALAMQRGNLREAEDRLRQAIAMRPDFGQARFNLGTIFLRQGRRQEALQYFERAARLGFAGAEREVRRLRQR